MKDEFLLHEKARVFGNLALGGRLVSVKAINASPISPATDGMAAIIGGPNLFDCCIFEQAGEVVFVGVGVHTFVVFLPIVEERQRVCFEPAMSMIPLLISQNLASRQA